MLAVLLSFVVGVSTIFFVEGTAENFFVAGRSLPLALTAMTLAAQCLDSNALLGNVDYTYQFSFWDGKREKSESIISRLPKGFFKNPQMMNVAHGTGDFVLLTTVILYRCCYHYWISPFAYLKWYILSRKNKPRKSADVT